MNRDKWIARAETGALTYSQWLAKLAEEFGEVAREVTVLQESPGAKTQIRAEGNLLVELDQVIFIADCMKTAVERRRRLHA